MRLLDIMNCKVETVSATESAERAWRRMRLRKIHHLVVVHDARVMGVLSDRDLGGSRGASLRKGRIVAHLMTPFVISAKPTTTIQQAANMMRGHPIGCLPVMEDRKLVGIVTVADLLALLSREAERPVPKTKRSTVRHRDPKHPHRIPLAHEL